MDSASNRPANPYPQFNDFGEARAYLDFIRQSSWNGIEHVIKFLSDRLQEKTNYIEALRAEFTASQNALNAKIYSMDQVIIQLERQLQEKDAIVRDRNSTVQQLQQRRDADFEESNKMRTRISFGEQTLRFLSAQNEQLKLKLTQAEQQQLLLQLQLQQQQKQPVTNLEFNLTEEQEKELRVHIEEEITKRATEVSAKAKEKIAQTFKRWQDRIKELEEQLEASRAKNDKNDTSDKLVRRQSVPHPDSHTVIQTDPPLPPQDRSDIIADELNFINQQHNVVSDGV